MIRTSSPRTDARSPIPLPHPRPSRSPPARTLCAPRRASLSRARPRRSIARRTSRPNRRRRSRTPPRPPLTRPTFPRPSRRIRRASRRPPPPRRPPRPARPPQSPRSPSRTPPSHRPRSPRRMRVPTRPSSSRVVDGGAMGRCTSCARGAAARRGMGAWNAARELRRRVSSCRVVGRGVSCPVLLLLLLPLPLLRCLLSVHTGPLLSSNSRHIVMKRLIPASELPLTPPLLVVPAPF